MSLARERTYRALVAATAGADAAYVDRTTTAFRAWYRSSLPHVRASVDATLDSLRVTGLRKAHPNTAAQAVALARLPVSV